MASMRAYYDRRAPEYDDWYTGEGLFAARERPGWEEERAAVIRLVAGLPPARVLDVACGTGYLTRHLQGAVLGLDQSAAMLSVARGRAPRASWVRGDALALPFPDRRFDRVFVAHFYGHLLPDDRALFLGEARAVGDELVIVDAACRGGPPRDEWQERILSDGSRHKVFKRFFSAPALLAELGGGKVLHEGHWFVAVTASSVRRETTRAAAAGWGD
ncbi:MAG TPA: methyltransferase domain-containing protein [Vicinamibacteria bacterium]|nr:methyltransferase domain-containing protein [Vicinamibacteria bacterium]